MSPVDLFLEAIDAPQRGWPGRRRYIARQLIYMVWEAAFFLLFILGMLGCIVLVASSIDSL